MSEDSFVYPLPCVCTCRPVAHTCDPPAGSTPPRTARERKKKKLVDMQLATSEGHPCCTFFAVFSCDVPLWDCTTALSIRHGATHWVSPPGGHPKEHRTPDLCRRCEAWRGRQSGEQQHCVPLQVKVQDNLGWRHTFNSSHASDLSGRHTKSTCRFILNLTLAAHSTSNISSLPWPTSLAFSFNHRSRDNVCVTRY